MLLFNSLGIIELKIDKLPRNPAPPPVEMPKPKPAKTLGKNGFSVEFYALSKNSEDHVSPKKPQPETPFTAQDRKNFLQKRRQMEQNSKKAKDGKQAKVKRRDQKAIDKQTEAKKDAQSTPKEVSKLSKVAEVKNLSECKKQ